MQLSLRDKVSLPELLRTAATAAAATPSQKLQLLLLPPLPRPLRPSPSFGLCDIFHVSLSRTPTPPVLPSLCHMFLISLFPFHLSRQLFALCLHVDVGGGGGPPSLLPRSDTCRFLSP